MRSLLFASTMLAIAGSTTASPVRDRPVPIVIWHGLGDRYDAPGLLELKSDLESRPGFEGVYVHLIGVGDDGSADQRASFFGSANAQVAQVCERLLQIPEITEPDLNPSGVFDAVGFSQGGVLLRALVERCGGKHGLNVRNLITVGSPHMGVEAVPPCPPGTSPFSACRLMHIGLVKEGLYSGWAQKNVVPAQYFRDESRIDDYLMINQFLRDINNERVGDEEVGPVPSDKPVIRKMIGSSDPRNGTYKDNLSALNKLVLLRFSRDITLVPPQTAHFTLPSPLATNCPTLPDPVDPACYLDPVSYDALPLYESDYVGLKKLDQRGGVVKGVCEGAHMEITDDCWEEIVSWLGKGDGKCKQAQNRTKLVLQGV